MAFLTSLLSLSEPKGFWETIIKAFEAVTNNYVLAIIFLTVVLRLAWALVDTLSKFNSQRMSAIQAKMAPEEEKLKLKYANQPEIYQKKQKELYNRYFGKSGYGSCFLTITIITLNLAIFFTLFSSLNGLSAYKIASNYDNIKTTYANCLNVADKYLSDSGQTQETKNQMFFDYKNLVFEVLTDEQGEQTISLYHIEENGDKTKLASTEFKHDFSQAVEGESEETEQGQTANQYIISLIDKYYPVYEEGEEAGSKEKVVGYIEPTEPGQERQPVYLSTALAEAINVEVIKTYDQNNESFLWIKNIWIADSPLNESIVSFSTLKSQVGRNVFEEGEERIYDTFMPYLKDARSRANGYFILPLLCVLTAMLSMSLTKIYNNKKNQKKGIITPPQKGAGRFLQFLLPILLGIFAFLYNSVFAIYMVVSQLVAGIIMIPQLMLVDYVIGRKNQKKEKEVEVEYSRKF